MRTDNLKCRNCKPPERTPYCHSTCKYYLEWQKEKEIIQNEIKKKKWYERLGKPQKKKRERK